MFKIAHSIDLPCKRSLRDYVELESELVADFNVE